MQKLQKIAFLFTISLSAYSQDPITAEQAAKMVGQEVTVKDVVAGSRLFEKDGKKTFLINLAQRYPQTSLTIVLYTKAYEELNLKQEIEDKTIIVKGKVTLYNDKPQILVDDVKNLKIVE
jgi:DNA/RNA endonuclease YhcR with UshA esterase domain